MIYPIKLESTQDVVKLNNFAANEDYDLSVSSGNTMIDAKSLLALFTLVGKTCVLVAPDHLTPKKFMKLIERMGLTA